ncbi:DNA helicase [Luteitalea sp. TBR-22]|uniref:ATP-dependent helicase n=1 Tax=Luteitalea sp. TBR-22 TaxID=2802971 RepID=UPI001AF6E6AA|nr:UvrD-helicase domain-containing protein [Luteitalea sp. TBR-22]BCS30805.1 DNA helicase [Luteitalea sp. TBR-22]
MTADRRLPTAGEDFLSSLNPEQRDAVLHTDGPLLILAGAGSGKTRVIAYRIAYLIGSGLARPFEVLAVTFTNKAAEEMRERVGKLIGADARDVWVSTFHSLCARLLRREAPAIGLSRDFVIYDSSDQQVAVKQVMRELQIDDKLIQPRQVLGRISQAKNRMEAPDKVGNGSYRDEQIAKIYDGYVKALERANALDFDDLLLKTVELFEHEGVRSKYQRQFRYVMIDEYQDTNRPQYLLIKHLVGARHNLAVVGDPDQSIYKWRGADLRNILDFEQDFPEAATVRLERNYRSTQNILDAASAVIANNADRKEKRLWTEQGRGDLITYFRGEDELEEASFIARELRKEVTARRDATVAILYRLNSQSRALEDQLMRDGTPYRIIGGVRFYERKEVKDALSYLKLIINPHDDVSFRRVVNVPARGIGKSVMDALERDDPGAGGSAPPMMAAGLFEVAASQSLWARATHLIASRTLPGRAHNALKQFVELIDALVGIAKHEPVSTLIGKMLDQSGYLKALREENTEEAESRINNLAEFVSTAREYEEREADASIGGFVDRLSLLSEADESQGSNSARVWLMTMHAAKGLEFPVVALAGMEEGLFPHSRAGEDQEQIEEERRLCYVGMTRAQSRLLLTSAARRRVFGEYQATEPSRFLDEIPKELVLETPSYTRARSFGTSSYGGRAAYESRPNPYGRRTPAREEAPATTYKYEDEDQSSDGSRPKAGQKVRHAQFGVGTVKEVDGKGDDMKLTVYFQTVGTKKLIAKYARLQPV